MGLGSLFTLPGEVRDDQPQSLPLTPQLPICHMDAEGGGSPCCAPGCCPSGEQGWPTRKGVRIGHSTPSLLRTLPHPRPRLPGRPVGEGPEPAFGASRPVSADLPACSCTGLMHMPTSAHLACLPTLAHLLPLYSGHSGHSLGLVPLFPLPEVPPPSPLLGFLAH